MSSSEEECGESCVELKSMCASVYSGSANDRREFLSQLYDLIGHWKGDLPNLGNIFRPRELDWLLAESVTNRKQSEAGYPFVDFVIRTGYVDESEVDKDGKPWSRRTTALHRAAQHQKFDCIRDLFKIYKKFDVNYVDEESGLTHFHAACVAGLDDVVEKFLDLGQNPNCPSRKSVDAPLHLALRHDHVKVVELLMESGAFPNLANEDGSTPLHVISQRARDDDLMETFFRINDDILQKVQLDARDKSGDTPLHYALRYDNARTAETLLRRGANPNLVDALGSTPLQIVCQGGQVELVKLFFRIVDETGQTVDIDARDASGRTPLRLAVENLWADVVDLLLDRGADLTNFVFSIKGHLLNKDLKYYECMRSELQLELACGVLAVTECLEKRGYQLGRADALKILHAFAEQGIFEAFATLEKYWYEYEELTTEASQIMINPRVSLDRISLLRPGDAAKQFKCLDCFALWRSGELWTKMPAAAPRRACIAQLNEIMSRALCRRWAYEAFMELTRYRVPVECCDAIIGDPSFKNEDLYKICLAAAGCSS
ncbi:unnamed protein product [Trichogramma brassicae]|uniref:Uncharacterized protein n=1 Tax=Trichogramma brassicae TaxID=86971 RepID=A0A6H5IQL8_9HYME|nr:unnamed protein product [Trichogramma brassicae]